MRRCRTAVLALSLLGLVPAASAPGRPSYQAFAWIPEARPFVVFTFDDLGGHGRRRFRTPRGMVSVRWREDAVLTRPAPPGEISHPDWVQVIVVTSPKSLPVLLRVRDGYSLQQAPGNVKSVQINGQDVSFRPDPRPPRGDGRLWLSGGRNVVRIVRPDPE
jgi:hypothetical protein